MCSQRRFGNTTMEVYLVETFQSREFQKVCEQNTIITGKKDH